MTLRELMECWLTGRQIRCMFEGVETTGIINSIEHAPGREFHMSLMEPESFDAVAYVIFSTLGRSDQSPLDAEILDRSIYSLPEEMTR